MRLIKARVLTILPEVYGDYNRLLQAWTDEGLIEGVVKEESCQGLNIGEHEDVMVELYESFAGTRLVAGVVITN